MKKIKFFLLAGFILSFASCFNPEPAQENVHSRVINFNEIMQYAKKAEAVYGADDEIKDEFGAYSNIYFGEGGGYKLKWFIQKENTPSNKLWIVIRGTSNVQNVYADVSYPKVDDELSNILLHKGFAYATREVYSNIKKHLDKNSEVYIVGHSLGGASAAIMAIWLRKEGYNVALCYTFGQPKITNEIGAQKYKDLPLIRVVNQGDPVPHLPPDVILDELQKDPYVHFGREVKLQPSEKSSPQNNDKSIMENLWDKIHSKHIESHYMKNYISAIKQKLDANKEAP